MPTTFHLPVAVRRTPSVFRRRVLVVVAVLASSEP